MTKQEVLALFNGLNKVGSLVGVKFAYGVSKNLSKLKPEVEALEKSLEAPETYKSFDDARLELAKSHAVRDEDGNPTVKNSNFVLLNESKFEAELEELKKEHKDAVDAREIQLKEYEELLKTDVSLDLHKIKLDDVPAEITTAEMFGILPIIEE